MSKADWKVSEGDRPPEQFWVDFGNFVMASYNFDDTDEYWEVLCRWATILTGRYNNKAANAVVFDYLNSQSARSIRQEQKDWRAHREKSTA